MYACIHRIPKSGNMNHCPQSLEPMPARIEKRRGSSGLQVPLPTFRRSSRTSQAYSQASHKVRARRSTRSSRTSQASRKVRVSDYNLMLADFVEKERRLSRFDRAGLERINERVVEAKATFWQNTYMVCTVTLIPICFLVCCLVLVIVLDDTLPTS